LFDVGLVIVYISEIDSGGVLLFRESVSSVSGLNLFCNGRKYHTEVPVKIYIIPAIAALLAVSFSCKKQETRQIITVNTAVGEVKLLTAKGEIIPKSGDAVSQGDTVITGKASLIDLVYSDNGFFRINENSNVRVETLMAGPDQDNARLAMDKGKLFVTISRLKKNSSFEVKSSTSVAAVRGTSLRVTSDENGSRVDVLKGKVNVVPVNKGNAMPESAQVVEENRTVALDVKAVTEIAEKKAEIVVTIIPKEEVKAIQEEIKSIQQSNNVNAEVIQETQQIITAPAIDESAERGKQERARLEKERADRAERARIESARAAQAARDRAAKETAEKAKEAVTQPQRKEQKNIPLAPNL
jgi:hypothetical protein